MSKAKPQKKKEKLTEIKQKGSVIKISVGGCGDCPFQLYQGSTYACFISDVDVEKPDAFMKCPLKNGISVVEVTCK
jgi:hypothetical protein